MRRSAATPLLQSPDSPSYRTRTSSLYPTIRGYTPTQLLPYTPGTLVGGYAPLPLGRSPGALHLPSNTPLHSVLGCRLPSLTKALPVGSGLASLGLRPPTHYIINTFFEHPKIRIIFDIPNRLPVGSGLASLGLRPPTHYIINTFIGHVNATEFMVCEAYPDVRPLSCEEKNIFRSPLLPFRNSCYLCIK